jgi:hypothetical protein
MVTQDAADVVKRGLFEECANGQGPSPQERPKHGGLLRNPSKTEKRGALALGVQGAYMGNVRRIIDEGAKMDAPALLTKVAELVKGTDLIPLVRGIRDPVRDHEEVFSLVDSHEDTRC